MTNKLKNCRRFLTAVCLVSFLFPVISSGDDTGHDWYCPDPEGHAQYEKHRKQHHDHDARVMADKLALIYQDTGLTAEQQKAKATGILDDYAAKVKMGQGD